MVNAQTSYNYLAQPVPQYSHMVPPGMPTTTIPPLALHAPHPPPLQSLRIEQERVANLRAQEDRAAEEERAAAAADFAATAGGMDNPPPFTEAGTGAPPPVNNDRTHAAAGQDDIDLLEQDRALSAMSLHTHRSSPTTEMSWDLNNGGQIFWDPTSNSNAQHVDPRLTNSARQPPKKARLEQQQASPISRGIMMPPEAVDPPPIQEICPPNCNSNRM